MKRPHAEQGARRKPKSLTIDFDRLRRESEIERERVAQAVREGKSLSEIIRGGIERTAKR